MKYFPFLNVALLSLALPSGSSATAAAQAGQTTTAVASIRISADFTKKIDTKDARAGDEISARLSFDAAFSDGTVLPKGTRLTGTVTEVRAKSNSDKGAHLALNFNQAVLQDGRKIQLHSTLMSLTVPVQIAMPGDPADMVSPAGSGARGPSTGAPTDLSPATDVGPSVGRRGTTSTGRSSGGLGAGAIGRTAADAADDAQSAKVTGLNDPRAEGSSANGTYVSDALKVHHYPVGNMPGVVLSSQATATISGVLDAGNQNIRLESGTKMTLNASIVAP